MMKTKTPTIPKSENERLLLSFDHIWIVYVLRLYSDRENPLSKKEISMKVVELTGLGRNNSVERTIARHITQLECMSNYFAGGDNKQNIGEVVFRVLGGRIRVVDGRPMKYWFEPILEKGDVSMICAAIESNRYLSREEKDYLISHESAVCSYMEGVTAARLPHKPGKKKSGNVLPSADSVTLMKIATIQYAIKKKLMLKVVPGAYSQDKGKIVFGPKSDKESFLNPYAFICQNGQFYLIVTHEGYDNPTHYRVDRMFSVEIAEHKTSKGCVPRKRDDIPLVLQRFFEHGKFNAGKYTAAYPLMAYTCDDGMEQCSFLCHADAASVAIDHFGVDVNMEATDDDGYVKFSVFADYENVKMFCTQQCMIVTALSPEKLRKDVRDTLRDAIERTDKSVN